jgi:membrane protease subunit HflK
MPDPAGTQSDDELRRSVARTASRAVLALGAIGVLGVWLSLGVFELAPGQGAISFLLGAYRGSVLEPGLHLRWPPPFGSHELVNVAEVRTENFGLPTATAEETRPAAAASVQTRDNSVVQVGFTVQYSIADPFSARYRLADATATLRTAAEAAIREVIGRHTVDEVLSTGRAVIAPETQEVLQQILDGYSAGLTISGVELQELQPPHDVQAAFDDVIAAQQDKSRLVNEAEAHRNEVLPRARGEAAEIEASAAAHRETVVARATGEAGRFAALRTEYAKAPEVTRQRLYLETLEDVLPRVEKVVVEPGAAPALPFLPVAPRVRAAAPARAPAVESK